MVQVAVGVRLFTHTVVATGVPVTDIHENHSPVGADLRERDTGKECEPPPLRHTRKSLPFSTAANKEPRRYLDQAEPADG
jgi:hypothetical protein